MKSQALSYFTDTHLTILGLLIFFVYFIAIILRTTHKSQLSKHKHLSTLPLEEGLTYERK